MIDSSPLVDLLLSILSQTLMSAGEREGAGQFNLSFIQSLPEKGDGCWEGISLPEKLQLKLAESKPFKSGCVALRYLKQ